MKVFVLEFDKNYHELENDIIHQQFQKMIQIKYFVTKVVICISLIGFFPPIRGNNNYFSVIDYGAKADGSTFNTSIHPKAIDACSNSGGETVYFPKGVFLSGTEEKADYFPSLWIISWRTEATRLHIELSFKHFTFNDLSARVFFVFSWWY